MFQVPYSETSSGQRWTLYGPLVGRWIDELRAFWRRAPEREPHTHALADLKDVDEAGEDLLKDMYGAGAEFVVAEVEVKQPFANAGEKENER